MTKSHGAFAVGVGTQTDSRTIGTVGASYAANRQGTGAFRMGIGTDGNTATVTVGNRVACPLISFNGRCPELVSSTFIDSGFHTGR